MVEVAAECCIRIDKIRDVCFEPRPSLVVGGGLLKNNMCWLPLP